MDFFQFLEISKKNKLSNKTPKNDVNENVNESTNENFNLNKSNVREYEFKTGDFIKIKRKSGSVLNIYKGYIGEIKDYKKGQFTALIMLNALYSQPYIQFPIDHFELLT